MGKPGKTRETEKGKKTGENKEKQRKKVENKAIENYKSKGANKEKIGKYRETGENIGRQGKWKHTVRETEEKKWENRGDYREQIQLASQVVCLVTSMNSHNIEKNVSLGNTYQPLRSAPFAVVNCRKSAHA